MSPATTFVSPASSSLLIDNECRLMELQCIRRAAGIIIIIIINMTMMTFVEYEKLIYMDADFQMFKNIDNLFDLPCGLVYAVVDCLCEMPCEEKVKWPKELGNEPPFYFNGGMFVFEPRLTTYNKLLTTLEVTPPTPFAEQDFLNFFFKSTSKPIPYFFNLLVAMLWRHPDCVDLDEVKVVHFCVTGSKPWRYNGNEQYMDRADVKMLIDKWWDIYNDATLDFTGNEGVSQASV